MSDAAPKIDPDRLAEAVAFAGRAHDGQVRKGEHSAAYICHLLSVSGLVIEHGGDTDQAIAALLHDALEDCADVTGASLRAAFGERVARIVQDCTDTLAGDSPEQKSPWEERKRRYLEHLAGVPDESLLVAVCDKRHNLGALVGDLRAFGLGALRGFNAGPMQQMWYYEEFLRRISGRVPARLQLELEDLTFKLRGLFQAGDTQRFKTGKLDGELDL